MDSVLIAQTNIQPDQNFSPIFESRPLQGINVQNSPPSGSKTCEIVDHFDAWPERISKILERLAQIEMEHREAIEDQTNCLNDAITPPARKHHPRLVSSAPVRKECSTLNDAPVSARFYKNAARIPPLCKDASTIEVREVAYSDELLAKDMEAVNGALEHRPITRQFKSTFISSERKTKPQMTNKISRPRKFQEEMIEAFVQLLDSSQGAGFNSTWQGVLSFQTNVNLSQLVSSAIQVAGRAASHIDPQNYTWRFLYYNHKFGEYCDIASSSKRTIADGDKFQLVFTPKDDNNVSLNWAQSMIQQINGVSNPPSSSRSSNGVVAMAEVHNQMPLIFPSNNNDEEEEFKPSLDSLFCATTSAFREDSAEPANGVNNNNQGEEPKRRRRRLPSEIIRQELGDENDEFYEDYENTFDQDQSVSPNSAAAKRQKLTDDMEYDESRKARRSRSQLEGPDEDGPCKQHATTPEICSHSRFRQIDAMGILQASQNADSILDHLNFLKLQNGAMDIDQNVRCKLMNVIGNYLMHQCDEVGLPTAVERRILVSTFLSQLPYQLDPAVFTNRAGTGCLDYWVRNRRKTAVREDGVYMVRGSKRGSKKS